MIIGAPREILEGESRVAMTPESAKALMKLGYECQIETMAGANARFQDADYEAVGVKIAANAAALHKACDIILKVRAPIDAEIAHLKKGQNADLLGRSCTK